MLKNLKTYALAAGIGLAGLLGSTAHATEPEHKPTQEQQLEWRKERALAILPGIAEIFIARYAKAPIHESGHALTGLAFGAEVENFAPYPHDGKGGTVKFEEKSYKKLSQLEKNLITIAGPAASRLTAEGLDTLMNHTDMHPRAQQMLAALYFMTRLELAEYALIETLDSLGNYPGQGDFDKLIDQVTKKRKTKNIIYGALLGAIAADIALDWDEIKDNWRRLWMLKEEPAEETAYNISVMPAEKGMHASFTYKF